MACDSLHRLNFGGSNNLLFDDCQWSEAQQTNVDVTTVACDKIPEVYGPMENYTAEYLAMFAAKCIPTPAGAPGSPEAEAAAAEEKNRKIKLIAFILIAVIIIAGLILFF